MLEYLQKRGASGLRVLVAASFCLVQSRDLGELFFKEVIKQDREIPGIPSSDATCSGSNGHIGSRHR